MKKPHKIFFAQKNKAKFLFERGLSNQQLPASSWMLKCNASAVVAVAEKIEYRRICCITF